jgi:RimJ/RimL family protein N-acetyltransferase
LGAVYPRLLRTDRLLLRPTLGADADWAFAIQSDWEVTRMLRMASFPPDECAFRRWFADHTREWQAGQAYRFAVELEGAGLRLRGRARRRAFRARTRWGAETQGRTRLRQSCVWADPLQARISLGRYGPPLFPPARQDHHAASLRASFQRILISCSWRSVGEAAPLLNPSPFAIGQQPLLDGCLHCQQSLRRSRSRKRSSGFRR